MYLSYMRLNAIECWNAKLEELGENRNGRIPRDRAIEEGIVRELETIWARLTPEEQAVVERPLSPRHIDRPIDLIALDDKGRLIGYEDLDDEPRRSSVGGSREF